MRKASEELPALFDTAITRAFEIGKEVAYLRTGGNFAEANVLVEKYQNLIKDTVRALTTLGTNVDQMIAMNDELTASTKAGNPTTLVR